MSVSSSDNGLRRMPGRVSRRTFMAGTAAASFSIVKPGSVRGTQANSRIRLGLIGCGMRGKWISNLFAKHGGYEIVTVADYFQDRVDYMGAKFDIPADRLHTGLSGYKRLLDQRPDAVAIESPPFFHPEQATAAIDAGVHVNLAKPIAVDVPGCLKVQQAGSRATASNLCFLVDFQTRANALYREAVQRVRQGDIGEIGLGEACFNGSDVWNSWNAVAQFVREKPGDPEARLKAWGMDNALSGSILVEQTIHSIDVATWILDAAPVAAEGSGSRRHYQEGDIWDTFAVICHFPDKVDLLLSAKQWGAGYSDIGCRVYGTQGTIDTHYGGNVSIRGSKPFAGGPTGDLYTLGTSANIALFHENITNRRFENPTVVPSVRSNLSAILSREAAHKRRTVTWDEMIRANEQLESDIVRHLKA
ncbi:MAG: Gfo/Idh/MocA family oxidoreductase [Acidobacteria bacterium]|nr:Gfo/Idh/MocA family oxidoreductase [Acidobacteriota bacterium]